jgi:hypothetical protein
MAGIWAIVVLRVVIPPNQYPGDAAGNGGV